MTSDKMAVFLYETFHIFLLMPMVQGTVSIQFYLSKCVWLLSWILTSEIDYKYHHLADVSEYQA